MNRRQLFRTLIYAPLIAPLVGMKAKPIPIFKPGSMSTQLCFTVSASTERGKAGVRKMSEKMHEFEIQILGDVTDEINFEHQVSEAWVKAARGWYKTRKSRIPCRKYEGDYIS